jgi:uncharacterized protein YjdB
VEIYNNTLYDCGSHSASFANNGSFMINGGDTSLLVKIRNNVMCQIGSEPFGDGGGWNSTYVTGSNNVTFSTGGQAAPNILTGNIAADPLFLATSSANFHLQTGSPAIDAGVTVSGSNTYNNYLPWNDNPRDHDGIERPQRSAFDIGAYEAFAGGTQPTPTLQSIAVTPNPASVNVGSTIVFTAMADYSDGSTQNVTSKATWTSSNSSIGNVSSGGVATGITAGGPVTISASVSGVGGSTSLTVNRKPIAPILQSVSVMPTLATVVVGSTTAFTATGHYSDGSTQNVTSTATWTSSNSSIAIVSSSGVATGITAGGPVTISASVSGVGGSATLTVNRQPPVPIVQSISITPTLATVVVGSTIAFTATAHYSDGSAQNVSSKVTWLSSTPSFATVSTTGVATGLASGGPVTIGATLSGFSGTASLTVTSKPPTVVVNFDSPAPSGSPYSALNGVFGGINFGTNQWAWEAAYLSDPTNNIYFSSGTGNSRTFQFASGSHVLVSMKVATSVPGTLTLSDNLGQVKTQSISTGSLQLVTTGWKNPSTTITVTFTAGWNIEFDDITYSGQ